jgi:D-galactonate transporter
MEFDSAAKQMEAEVMRKVGRRLLPFVALLFFVAYLDRVNVGFAAISMNADLKLSAAAYGVGAGLFFVGYFLLEIPSNVLLARYGARRWLSRIMITWGLISAAMMFVRNEPTFYVLRFALGMAEAGFFPGVIYYMTAWFPTSYRGRAVGWFMFAAPVSNFIGAPISSWLLAMDGQGGLKGWQWLFLTEGLPAVLLGVLTLFYLTDKPREARWLTQEQAAFLEKLLAAERAIRTEVTKTKSWQVVADFRVWALVLIGFGFITGMIGLSLWLPQIVKGFGLTIHQTGLVTAIPYFFASTAMIYWGRHSDRRFERPWHVAISGFLACAGFVASAVTSDPRIAVVMLTVAAVGVFSGAVPFWSWVSSVFSGTTAAVGIAFINSTMNLGGFFGPAMFGWLKNVTGSFTWPLVMLGMVLLAAALLSIGIGRTGRTRDAFTTRVSESG